MSTLLSTLLSTLSLLSTLDVEWYNLPYLLSRHFMGTSYACSRHLSRHSYFVSSLRLKLGPTRPNFSLAARSRTCARTRPAGRDSFFVSSLRLKLGPTRPNFSLAACSSTDVGARIDSRGLMLTRIYFVGFFDSVYKTFLNFF